MEKISSEKGFTLLEVLVTTTLFLIIFIISLEFFQQHQKLYLQYRSDTELTQNARIALETISYDLRIIGYHLDHQEKQPALIEAAPFQIIFNTDKQLDIPTLPNGGIIKLSDGSNYVNTKDYSTGAETIRWSLDSTDDGIIDKNDIGDDEEEQATRFNDNDFILIREMNGGPDQQVALYLIGPVDAKNNYTYVVPLFQYWILSSSDTLTLWGDTDGNGVLEGEEKYFPPITSQDTLEKIKRITVTITVESDEPNPLRNPPTHKRITLSSEVALRNRL